MNNESRLNKIIESIRSSLESNNHFAALTSSLILIDICAKVHEPFERENNKRYKKWIDDILITKIDYPTDYLSSSNICFLRYAMMHAGSTDPTLNKSYQKFGNKHVRDIVPTIFPKDFDDKFLVANQGEQYPTLFFDLIYFCEMILIAASDWIVDNIKDVDEANLNLFSMGYTLYDKNSKLLIFRS